MENKMADDASQEYGIRGVVRGGLYADRRAKAVTPIDPWLDREMQGVFAALHGESGALPSRAIYDASEGYQWPWRRIGQRIREARAGNTPKEKVKGIIRVLESYIDEQYAESPDRAA